MLNIQNYVRAESLEQAYELNQNRRSHVLGGMLWLRQSDITVGTAIDLSGLGLDTIEETDEEYRIGAMVPLRKLEHHPGIAALTGGAVENALKDIVGVQFRNMATGAAASGGGSDFPMCSPCCWAPTARWNCSRPGACRWNSLPPWPMTGTSSPM